MGEALDAEKTIALFVVYYSGTGRFDGRDYFPLGVYALDEFV